MPCRPLRLHPTPQPTPRASSDAAPPIARACAQVLPLAAVLYLTLPDVRKPRSRKWYAATFVGAVLWIGVFSYFMVWSATTIGSNTARGGARHPVSPLTPLLRQQVGDNDR